MSIGRNKGSKSYSETNESAQQTTNYGEGDTLALSAGDSETINVESLDDDVVKDALGFADQSFERVVKLAADDAERNDEVLSTSLESIQTIAKDKATGVQQSQRMTYAVIGAVVLIALISNNTGKKKAS